MSKHKNKHTPKDPPASPEEKTITPPPEEDFGGVKKIKESSGDVPASLIPLFGLGMSAPSGT